ncbi:MAG: GAF domain-containing protein [Cyanobacteria bacterium P01_D01_bin.105]
MTPTALPTGHETSALKEQVDDGLSSHDIKRDDGMPPSESRTIQKQQYLLRKNIQAIRESASIEDIFSTTTEDLRKLLNVNRVAIYRFHEDWSGCFVAESYQNGQSSLLEKQKIFPELRENISDCSIQPLDIQPLDIQPLEETSASKDSDVNVAADTHLKETAGGAFTQKGTVRVCNDIYSADFTDCYIQALEKYETKAYVIGALHVGDQLWGLLAAVQSDGPRQWISEETSLLEQVSNQLGVALQQAEAMAQIQQQSEALKTQASSLKRAADLQKTLTRTIDKIRQSLDIQEIFDTATQEVRQLLQADRVAIYQLNEDWSGRFVAEAFEGKWVSIIEEQEKFPEIIQNVNNCSPKLLNTQGPADSFLQQKGKGMFARSESIRVCTDVYAAGFSDCYIETLEKYNARAYMIASLYTGDKIWGLIAAFQNDGPRNWSDEEISTLNQISSQLGIALKQSHTLETVSQQADDLKKATIRQAALSKTVDRIRNSLDIDEIFATTTQEVRQLLDVERVAIYRFNDNWSGSFVADSIEAGRQPSMPSSIVVEEVLARTNEASDYPRNELFVPITQGEKLWGLLMAYQTSTPRYWEEDEISLLNQVSGQLAIALSQSELLAQTRRQTKQLDKALKDLQQTQAQMVQGEKMAGLGQMMAGITHEINNPVSFVFSNVSPAEEHVADLLALLQLYQDEYPEPSDKIQAKAADLDIDFIAGDLPNLLNSMKMGAIRIRDIVKSMKVFSRMDEVDVKAVDIHEGIDSTLLILAHRMKGTRNLPAIQLIKKYADLPPVPCHAGQLNQVFMNLLSNGIEAFDGWNDEENASSQTLAQPPTRSPQIQIETERSPQGNAVIYIIDNGCGIPETALPNIFNPFFTTKPVGQGTGLGLSISYQIITEIHGGTLECHSSSEGTTFRIELPIAEDSLTKP